MSGYILRGGQENMTLPASAVESLLKRGEGDAALLYLALQRFGRGVTPEELEKVLPTMSRLRLDAAEGVLQELGLLPRPQQPRPEPAAERPAYSAEDITALLTDNEGFRLLGRHPASSPAVRWPFPARCAGQSVVLLSRHHLYDSDIHNKNIFVNHFVY